MKRLLVIASVALLGACTTLGLTTPQSPSQGLAYAYGTVASVRASAAQALTAGTLTTTQAQGVLSITDQARTALDAGEAVIESAGTQPLAATQAQTVANDLATATALLAQAQKLFPAK